MPSRSIETSRQSAQNAMEYVKQFQMTAITHPRFATLNKEEQNTIIEKMYQVRALGNLKPEDKDMVNSSFENFLHSSFLSAHHHAGNCKEQAYLALDYIQRNDKEAHAEVYQFDKLDHAFVVVDREKNSDPTKPSSWGKNATICDPWNNEIYPASALTKKRNYKMLDVKLALPSERSVETMTFRDYLYDPKIHKPMPIDNVLNTDEVRAGWSQTPSEHIINSYKKKSSMIAQGLQEFRADVTEVSKKLSAKKLELPLERVQNKHAEAGMVLTGLEKSLEKIEQKKKYQEIGPNDYWSVRKKLEEKIQRHLGKARTAVEASQRDAPLIGKDLAPASKKALEQFDTLKNVTPSQVKPLLNSTRASAQNTPTSMKLAEHKSPENLSMSAAPDTITSLGSSLNGVSSQLPGLESSKMSKSSDLSTPKESDQQIVQPK
jgi:hypothetical protein